MWTQLKIQVGNLQWNAWYGSGSLIQTDPPTKKKREKNPADALQCFRNVSRVTVTKPWTWNLRKSQAFTQGELNPGEWNISPPFFSLVAGLQVPVGLSAVFRLVDLLMMWQRHVWNQLEELSEVETTSLAKKHVFVLWICIEGWQLSLSHDWYIYFLWLILSSSYNEDDGKGDSGVKFQGWFQWPFRSDFVFPSAPCIEI